MTLTTFLYTSATIFGIEAALLFFAACGDVKRSSERSLSIGFGLCFVGLAWGAVHYAAGLP